MQCELYVKFSAIIFKKQQEHYFDYIFICDLSIQSRKDGYKNYVGF